MRPVWPSSINRTLFIVMNSRAQRMNGLGPSLVFSIRQDLGAPHKKGQPAGCPFGIDFDVERLFGTVYHHAAT